MRQFIFTIVLVSILIGNILNAQTVPDSIYYKRLYYTGKVWGFVKYFHSEVAKGNINWDRELLETLRNVKDNVSNQDFANSLLRMLDMAGEMAIPSSPLPDLPDSLKYNLDLKWLHDTIFSDDVVAKLDTINATFRPQSNFFVGEAYNSGNPTFDNDSQFYVWGGNPYPIEEFRLLALFRYWNIINYFYPYKYIMDQNWDSTLVEFIPKIMDAYDDTSFHLSFLELATRINDSHALTYSELINENIVGMYYLPLTLKYIENETVITGIFTNNEAIKIGDIIKSINGFDIYTLRDSLRKYTAASNTPVIERNINTRILRGSNKTIHMIVENSEGQEEVTLSRNIYLTDYSDLIAKKDAIWKILSADSGRYGYVDMGRLQVDHIDSMFTDLWNTDGIIFDIRNYPQGTMWYMIRYLFDAPIHIAKFTVPDITYPGTLFWKMVTVGMGDFTNTYRKNIFILFDERTQSHAEYTVMALEQHPNAIKIGSQTSGADGNVSMIYLPGGMVTYFTGLGVFYPDYTETQRIGIIPDIEIHPTIAGVREGRDEVLEVALQYTPLNVAERNLSNQLQLPDAYLFKNYPNPFNPSTTIAFTLPKSEFVELKVYNILGKEVMTLVSDKLNQGNHTYQFDGKNLASGVYYYQLVAGDYREVKKMILLR